MKQSKLHSLLEQFVQAGLKFITAMIVMHWVLAPVFGYEMSLTTTFTWTFIMLCNSIFFGYWIRRGFNWYHHRRIV